MKKKLKLTIDLCVDFIIKLIFFFTFPAVFATAFSGVKYICTQVGMRNLLDFNSFLLTLVLVCGFTMVFGRFFCGFACAFGIYGDVLYELGRKIRKKMKKKPFGFSIAVGQQLLYGKYVVLTAIMCLCFLQKSDFVSMFSPWNVFSRLQSLQAPGSVWGVLLLIMISVGMVAEKRFFCRFICPMGAIFSLLPVFSFSMVKRDRENCRKGCRACQVKCPANLEIADANFGNVNHMGECFSCGKCVTVCSKENVSMGIIKDKKKNWMVKMVKAVLLFGLYLCLQI